MAMTEREEAIALANKVLETPSRDPDDDLSMMSRQFLRAIEPPPSLRGSGRTTRMLEHAKKLEGDGRAVYVVVDSYREVKRLTELLPPDTSIKIETEDSLGNFDWRAPNVLRGAHRNCVVLIDHYAIESRFRHLFDMMHAYD